MTLLLYKFSELNARHNSAPEDAFKQYGFQHRQIIDKTFEKRIEEMAGRYAGVLFCHEIAESREDIPEWRDIGGYSTRRYKELTTNFPGRGTGRQ
jgi:hypothetical protein